MTPRGQPALSCGRKNQTRSSRVPYVLEKRQGTVWVEVSGVRHDFHGDADQERKEERQFDRFSEFRVMEV